MSKKNLSILSCFFILIFVAVSFQNCAKVQMEAKPDAGVSDQSSNLDPNGNPTDITNLEQQSVTQNASLKGNNNLLDIVLVVDDSGSMKDDSLKLANSLEMFINNLAGLQIDWQMCLTTTDWHNRKGRAINWKKKVAAGTSYVLNRNDSSIATVFKDTIADLFAGTAGYGDERGVAALRANLKESNSLKCYRSGAVVSTLILSDEDERSIGGNTQRYDYLKNNSMVTKEIANLQANNIVNLEDIDSPSSYLQAFKAAHPVGRLISNSIVVKSNDYACQNIQLAVSPSFFGAVYEELSQLTGGRVGNICAADFTGILSDFASTIKNAFRTVQLECDPVDNKVIITQTKGPAVTWSRAGRTVTISDSSQDVDVQMKYACWIPKK